MKNRQLIIYSIIYGLIVSCFCIYWATNFSNHTTYKGDEFFTLAQFLLGVTYIFYLIIQFAVSRINFILLLSIPVLASIGAVLIGALILFVTKLTGIPRQYILLYGFFYALI